MLHILNLRRDPRDSRDLFYYSRQGFGVPEKVDMRPNCPPVYDQGQLGSCTGNGTAAALDIMHRASGNSSFFGPSRLFIYYGARDLEGNTSQDAGACIRDAVKTVANQGACRENPTWPYDISQFAAKPSNAAYAEALNFQATDYRRVTGGVDYFKDALASGFPVIFGIQVYESFESDAVARTGIVPMPNTRREKLLGGHCITAVGYDDGARLGGWFFGLFGASKGAIIFRNSWGEGWGDGGYGYLPYAFINDSNLTSDAWIIRKAE